LTVLSSQVRNTFRCAETLKVSCSRRGSRSDN